MKTPLFYRDNITPSGGNGMTGQNLITIFLSHPWEVAIILTVLGCIKIPTYEIRLLPYLLKRLAINFGNAINTELIARVEELEKGFLICSTDMRNDLHEHIKKTEVERIDRARSRILRFSDEVSLERGHSEEHYDEILKDIDKYEKYCREHPDYKNNKAAVAIEIIKDSYQECKTNHSFLVYKNKSKVE